MAGTRTTVEQALSEALRDRTYYDVSGGGATLSGGEPLLQAEFAAALLAELKHEAVHTTVETAGRVPWEAFESTRNLTDLYLFDIKHADDTRHREGTGRGNAIILRNLRRLAAAGEAIVVRHVLVPGYNMDQRSLDALASLMRELELPHLELLAFHRLGTGKYAQLARSSAWERIEPPVWESVREAMNYLSSRAACDVTVA